MSLNVARLVEHAVALYNERDAEALSQLYAVDAVVTNPGGSFVGLDSIKAHEAQTFAAFPDLHVSVGRRCQDGDSYFGEFTVRGTNTGPLVLLDGTEHPPTGRSMEFLAMHVITARESRITQDDRAWDRLCVLTQLGLVPSS